MSPYKNVPEDDDQVFMPDRASWRAWLTEHHDTRDSIWLIFHKKQSDTVSIDYESAVLEALCFGWIDSKVQRIDDERYRQYFSVRRPRGYWNGVNKGRVAALEKEGLMTEAGLRAIQVAKENGAWEFLDEVEAMVMPDDLAEALSPRARAAYEDFSNTKKQAILVWIKQAKRAQTRSDRIAKTAEDAERGETPLNHV